MNTQAVHTIELPDPDKTYIFNILVKPSTEAQAFYRIVGNNDLVEQFFLVSMKERRNHENFIVFRDTGKEDGYEFLVQKMISEFYNLNMYREDMMLLLFQGLLLELAREYRTVMDQELKEKLGNYRIAEIVQYIDDHCCDASVNTIAKQFHYHPKYVPNLIRRYTGSSFLEILTSARMRKAAVLLSETSHSISEVMQMVGYSNYSWFVEKFRKQYLMTPSAYRKLHQSNP